MSEGVLHGLSVLDLSTNVASAFTSLVLADFGAEVIQVEPPGGSPLRSMRAWPFWMRGKQSIVCDLDDPADVEVLRRLARSSDVVVEAFGAPTAADLGLDDADLRPDNPGLVYTSISAFGSRGPMAALKPYEAVVMAKTGQLSGNFSRGRSGEPIMTTPYGTTIAAALLALQGTFLALRDRETSGHGQRVDATMVQGLLAQDPWNYFLAELVSRFPEGLQGGPAPSAANPVPMGWLGFSLINGYTRDGRWLQFSNAAPRQYAAFLRVLGLDGPEWEGAADDEDATVREKFRTAILEEIRSRTADEWRAIFDRETDVFAEVYRRDLELLTHPQMLHNGHVVAVDDARLGRVTELAPLVSMSATPGDATNPAPDLDAHGPELRRRPEVHRPAPGSPAPPSAPPLDGVVVVDIGTYYAGPYASAMLADQGATVVKIEPLAGDPIRFLMPMPEAAGVRVTQGKKSVAVDVFADEGRALVLDLIRHADLVLHSYRGGVAERMGLDAASLQAVNPNLVYHHGVGYGIDGPDARRAAYAPTIAAGSGFARRCGGDAREGVELTIEEIEQEGYRLTGPPGGIHPDGMAALAVAAGMTLGLLARERGAGAQVTLTTMIATMAHTQGDGLIDYSGAPPLREPDPERYGFSALERLYRASDGWVVVCAVEDREWRALARAVGLADDARFTSRTARAANDGELAEALAGVLVTKPAQHWERELSAVGVGCAEVAPPGPGLGAGLFVAGGIGEQLGMVTRVTHPIFDEHVRATGLVGLSRGVETLGAGCTIGQHTDEVLRELLGYDDARIDELRAAGVIGGRARRPDGGDG